MGPKEILGKRQSETPIKRIGMLGQKVQGNLRVKLLKRKSGRPRISKDLAEGTGVGNDLAIHQQSRENQGSVLRKPKFGTTLKKRESLAKATRFSFIIFDSGRGGNTVLADGELRSLVFHLP